MICRLRSWLLVALMLLCWRWVVKEIEGSSEEVWRGSGFLLLLLLLLIFWWRVVVPLLLALELLLLVETWVRWLLLHVEIFMMIPGRTRRTLYIICRYMLVMLQVFIIAWHVNLFILLFIVVVACFRLSILLSILLIILLVLLLLVLIRELKVLLVVCSSIHIGLLLVLARRIVLENGIYISKYVCVGSLL